MELSRYQYHEFFGWENMSITLAFAAACVLTAVQEKQEWDVHDMKRPRPKVVAPPPPGEPAKPPAGAIVLFDGKDLSAWEHAGGKAAAWKVESGYMEVTPKSGTLQTKRGFGSCELHIEFCTPAKVEGNGQGRGNSGIHLMSKYEVQVLDSYENETYADGQCAAIYGQSPPLVNVCRKPGEWQTYDILFHAPVFDAEGKVTKKARVTVKQNGVLVQDNTEIQGETAHKKRGVYTKHADTSPITLQDHGNPMRFRNIWLVELKD